MLDLEFDKDAPSEPSPALEPVAISAVDTGEIIELLPVAEEEFQHSITHGRARVFEKWVGLQSRNRIINANQVEVELDEVLAGLYAAPVLVEA